MFKGNPKNPLTSMVLMITAIALLSGCSPWRTQPQVIENVTPKDAFTLLQVRRGDKDFVVLDVRTPGEFAEGHLENAINLDYYSDTFKEDLKKLDKSKTYLVYCRIKPQRKGYGYDGRARLHSCL